MKTGIKGLKKKLLYDFQSICFIRYQMKDDPEWQDRLPVKYRLHKEYIIGQSD